MRHIDEPTLVDDSVNNAIVADADAPEIDGTRDFFHTRGPWEGSQCINSDGDAPTHRRRKSKELALCRAREDDTIFSHARRALRAHGA